MNRLPGLRCTGCKRTSSANRWGSLSERDYMPEGLLDAGRALVRDLEPEAVLDRVLEEARRITGARFAAIGVLDERRRELEQFLTAGLDHEATHRAIGTLPRGRGVLGVLIEHPHVLRLADVSQHPESYGFPSGHPSMRSFLGVPIVIGGDAWGICTWPRRRAAAGSRSPTKMLSWPWLSGPRSRSRTPVCAR